MNFWKIEDFCPSVDPKHYHCLVDNEDDAFFPNGIGSGGGGRMRREREREKSNDVGDKVTCVDNTIPSYQQLSQHFLIPNEGRKLNYYGIF